MTYAPDPVSVVSARGLPHREGTNWRKTMLRLIAIATLCCVTLPALCQSTSKYEIATITEVTPHQRAADPAVDATTFDVSVKVGDTIYVVLYTTPLGEVPPKYAAGREMLVLVGKNQITYNDMLGNSLQVPIESQRPATETKASK
jgi:hypothetical protein